MTNKTLNYLNALSVQDINDVSGKTTQFTMHGYKVEIDLSGEYAPRGVQVHQPVSDGYCILLIVHRETTLVHGFITAKDKVKPLLKNMRDMWKLPRVVIKRKMFEKEAEGSLALVFELATDGYPSDFQVIIAEPVQGSDPTLAYVVLGKYVFHDANIHGSDDGAEVQPALMLGAENVIDV